MKEYRITLTENIFIKANSEEEAQEIFEDMTIIFENDGVVHDSDTIDVEITEVIG